MERWDELCKALSCGAKGSTVMVTTRKKDTAQLMAKIPELQHNVEKLSKEESWSLFEKHAFPGRVEGENVSSELELVGKEIVEKCNGLPLAVKTVGSLMSTKKNVNEWQLVNSNFMSEMQDNGILTSLNLECEDFEFSEQDLKKLRSLRSMLVFNEDYKSSIRQISSHVYLRVLHVNRIESSTLPESICKLIHLRYLKISGSQIEVLQESIINLQNLQVLILEDCYNLCELPKGLRYMRNLQRLDTGRYCPDLHHMPVGIKELTNLRRLSHFVVGKDDGAQIGELGNLNLLGWELTLSRLDNVGGLRDAKSANLKHKTNLKSLTLQHCDSEVVEGLEPNSGLQELTIYWYKGTVISPSWLVNLVNLTSIHFSYSKICEHLPQLGNLPSLKTIELHQMFSLKCFHDEDDAASNDKILFPNLQESDTKFQGSRSNYYSIL
nr:disease resistance protein [Tanacetum cinerariifolium]